MPAAPNANPPVALVFGEDDFSVKQRARQLYELWCREAGGMDHEQIDASALNSGEALRAIARVREALQTLPFFGAAKIVWFQNCNFLADDRTSSSAAVTQGVSELAEELKRFRWDGVRLLVSAGKVDKRKTFYKTLEKIGVVELFAGLSFNDKDWATQAELFARQALRDRQREITDEALAELVNAVGPNLRDLTNEVEKVSLFVGDRTEIGYEDVARIVTRHKHAKAFGLGEALGDRDLPRLLRTLDEDLWEIRAKVDRDKTEIGLLYGLISKVRALLLLKEAMAAGWLKPVGDYPRFKTQLERLPAGAFPEDKKFNLRLINPFVLFKALPQASNYSTAELVRAMELLLTANQRLVSTNLAEGLVLQQTLVAIVGSGAENSKPRRR